MVMITRIEDEMTEYLEDCRSLTLFNITFQGSPSDRIDGESRSRTLGFLFIPYISRYSQADQDGHIGCFCVVVISSSKLADYLRFWQQKCSIPACGFGNERGVSE